MRSIGLMFISTFTIAMVANPHAQADLKKVRPFKPLVVFTGLDSKVKEASLLRITTRDEWCRVWSAHSGTSDGSWSDYAPEIDFDRCMVVTVFRGLEPGVNRIRFDAAFESDDALHICIGVSAGYSVGFVAQEGDIDYGSDGREKIQRAWDAGEFPSFDLLKLKPEAEARRAKQLEEYKRDYEKAFGNSTPFVFVILDKSDKEIIARDKSFKAHGHWKEWKRIVPNPD
jgi:hypothetical protein